MKSCAEELRRNSDLRVGGVLKTLRPDLYAGYKNGKVVYLWDVNKAEKEYEIERKEQEFMRKMREQKTRGIHKKRGV